MIDNNAVIPEAALPWETDRLPEGDRGRSYRSVWNYLADVDFAIRHTMADGLRTRYLEAGDPSNDTVVLLHGTGGHLETFMANVPALAERYHVLAIDMLGCGFTDKPDKPYEIADYAQHVQATLSVLGIQAAAFVGVSLGSWVAVRIALDRPDLVSSLTLISATGMFELPGVPRTVALRRGTSANPSWDSTRALLADLFYDEKTVVDDLVAVRQRVYSGPGVEKVMPRMLTLFDPDIRARNNFTPEEWASIGAPTLIIAHVDVDDVFLRTARAAHVLIPSNELVEIGKSSHWAHFENPGPFNAALLDFLAANPGK
jgi:2-hydroxy-6-oxonona-2,4-dienedioate hydrolase